MPTRINRAEFLRHLESVRPGLSKTGIVEQSGCFQFNNTLVTTYNEEIACSHECPVGIVGAVEADPLLEAIKELPDDEVFVDAKNGKIVITSTNNRRRYRWRMESELLPQPVETPTKWIPLKEEFATAVDMAVQCAGRDEQKFWTVCTHITPKWVEGSDNYQAVRYKVKTPLDEAVQVRAWAIRHICDLGMVEMSVTATWVHFRNATGMIMSCRQYERDFRDISKGFDFQGNVTKLPKGLVGAAKRAEVVTKRTTDKKQNEVKITLSEEGVVLLGKAVVGDYREAKDMKYVGPRLTFYIAPKLLGQIVEQHNACEISADRLKVDGGRFVYVTSLTTPEEKEEQNARQEKEEK